MKRLCPRQLVLIRRADSIRYSIGASATNDDVDEDFLGVRIGGQLAKVLMIGNGTPSLASA
ncbi:hypothetical protein R69746_08748 [Paraburkholderia aspalathi]|uniref:hypothetical protein n=1 Tax=Paraburkholderia aspalathi TaxID=1324617 RepID=UPI00190B2C47|nr:hypothetical protein [Paraburkholderia aspalathi]MBK3844623.1 hypothetical protein [Paraburkholderia aspalathi]CAE6875481.1 hypothetical protein R69746_08748 [Paraburkholderia aspalathi]